ncbi:MAG: 2-oxoglutarate dehydrogenase complex dihydrolipoyllysine-residue succinyltransferase [Proteobacteria bacterium]|nr:2-oxoglutarate dehydrogenase complex dihydrolipoyllysine-residue succinyltransferase [Pseudomonadota bacterium]
MEIKVPPLGESVTEATVARWFKSQGETVTADEPLLELETEKVTLEVNAPVSGTLAEITVPEGTDVEVGALLGRIEEGGEKPAAPVETLTAGAASSEPAAPQPAAPQRVAAPPAQAPATEVLETPVLSPAVRKLVAENELDAQSIAGSGKGGRILKGDVLATIEGRAPAAPGTPAPGAPAPGAPAPEPAGPRDSGPRDSGPRPEAARETRVRMTRLRKRIAERLKEAQATAAMLTTFNEADMSRVRALRSEHRESFEKKHGVKLGFMSFFVKAAINALKEIPEANAEIEGDDIVYKNYYHIGVAVSTPQGLVVPVLRDADRMSFADIETSIAELAVKAREGRLSMEDLSGGTFTITNGGIFGSLMSTPIINPPQSAILGMHKIAERPMVIDGKVEIRPMMYLAVSYDHRLIDGRGAVTFLVRIKECIEDPERLLLDL